MVRRVAMPGGLLALNGGGEPGVKTLRNGLRRITGFAAGLRCMPRSGDTLGRVEWNASSLLAACKNQACQRQTRQHQR